MTVHSAGILLFRINGSEPELLLAHPGGPFFEGRDDGVWSILKGLCEEGESLLETARREFAEESGFSVEGDFIELGTSRLRSGKIVHAWGHEKDLDASKMVSNLFTMEWPRQSGRIQEYPEMDRFAWYSLAQARNKIAPGQAVFIDRLLAALEKRR